MGLVLSILYILTYYLTPETIFGDLAVYRVELILAVLLFVVSLPALARSAVGKTPQSIAVIGLAVAAFMSFVVGQHWPGGGVTALLLFIPNVFAYFLICAHFSSVTRVKLIVLTMLFVCLFVIGHGAAELYRGLPVGRAADDLNLNSSYFLGMSNNARQWFYRLKGHGQINDPNDFAQLIVCVLPLIFAFWRSKSFVRNFFVVLVPAGILIWGMYLTHSRGAILALLAIVIMAVRKKIGLIPGLLLAAVLFAAVSATNFSGGRDISTSAGADRTALWGDGLELLKAHPIFGVGFGLMPDYVSQTAHNSIVVCAAELGLFGLFFWSMFLVPSVRDAFVIASPGEAKELPPWETEKGTPYSVATAKTNGPDPAEIKKLGQLLLLSFTGFLVSGYFLSRAYVMTLFLLGGMTEVVFEMALKRGMISPRLPFGRLLRYSGVMTLSLVLFIYIMLRIINIVH
ncbi:MAG TPA: O-antigen ligase family protein [Edaphobacter sp.]|jgi:O-antigen ligase|nr:O-antigen ligase family protein [Edaphobacter sp.]